MISATYALDFSYVQNRYLVCFGFCIKYLSMLFSYNFCLRKLGEKKFDSIQIDEKMLFKVSLHGTNAYFAIFMMFFMN